MNRLNNFFKVLVSSVLLFSVISTSAANPTALLTISQADGTIWQEDMTGLLVVDAQNNFSLLQGGTTGLFQNGSFVSAVDTTVHPDFWQWKVDAATNLGSWSWHSAQTNSGATPTTTTLNDPWMTSLTLSTAGGHGDPDLSYAFSAVNNNTIGQTYTFAIGEAILPTVGSSNNVYADIAGGLTAKGAGTVAISPFGTNSAIQQFEISSDNGLSFVNAGVDVGPSASASGTSTYGPFSSNTIAGPVGQTWNYMQLTSKFTLSANSRASLVGYASITPVPEPENYAMLLSGLGLICFMLRRRNNSV